MTLEGMAAEAAARQAGAALADELEEIHRLLDQAKIGRDPRQATIQNRAFHFRLYDAAGLPALRGMIENIWLRTGPYHRQIFADPKQHVFDMPVRKLGRPRHSHRAVIEALRANRPSDVRKAIEADILSGDAVILPHLAADTPERVESLLRSLPELDSAPRDAHPQKKTGRLKRRPVSRREVVVTAAGRRPP